MSPHVRCRKTFARKQRKKNPLGKPNFHIFLALQDTHNEINRRTMTHPGGGTRYQLRSLVWPGVGPRLSLNFFGSHNLSIYLTLERHLEVDYAPGPGPEIALFLEPFQIVLFE